MIVQKYPINSAAKHMLEVYEKIRSRKSVSLGKKNSSRYLFEWRMKAEWDIYCNYIKSIVTSVFEGGFQKTEPIKICDTTGGLPNGARLCSEGKSEPDHHVTTEDGRRT